MLNTQKSLPGEDLSQKAGTVQDKQDMQRVGRNQELNVRGYEALLDPADPSLPKDINEKQSLTFQQRNFRFLSVLGFTAVLMCTWEAVLL